MQIFDHYSKKVQILTIFYQQVLILKIFPQKMKIWTTESEK